MSFSGMAACRAVSGDWNEISNFERVRSLSYLEETADAGGSNQRIKYFLRPFPEEINQFGRSRKEPPYVLE